MNKKTALNFSLPLAILAIVGSIAAADILMPNTSVIDGDAAKQMRTNIIQATGQKPTTFRGREVVSANAQVICSSNAEGDTACKVQFQK